MQIKVMTFNLRIDVPVDGDNQWRFRIPSVKAMIEKHQPDILMLQETTPAMLKDLENIESVYGYYYVGRNVDSQGEGCPVYYRKQDWRIKLADTIWLSQTPRTPGSMDLEEGFPRIASMVVLQHTSGVRFRFVNTHLAYRSTRAKDLNQKVLFDFIQNFPERIPTILGGDFNEEIPVIQKYRTRDFEFALSPEQGPTYHDFKGGLGTTQIDHLLYQAFFQVNEVMVDRQLSLGRLPSDHYPVIGVFQYES
jgi:endonuclease/exonuclease/phosphatase family metal-dependent hydrolase